MKKYFSFAIYILILTLSELLFAQTPPDTSWIRVFGGSNIDIAHDVEQTGDGGYILTGYTRSYGTASGRNVLLIKTDSNGNLLWVNGYGGNNDDEGYEVKQTIDGGYVVCGLTNSFGSGMKDVFLIKTDSLGNLLWTRVFGGSNDDEGYSFVINNDGSFLIAGVTSSFTSGGRDVYLIKTDANGNFQWQKNLGGLGSDGAWEIQKTNDNSFIIAGWTFSSGPGSLGNAMLMKVDSSGNQIWLKAYGGTDVDRGYSVKQTTDGGYILTGYTSSFGNGLDDMSLIKTDNLGNQQWMKTFGGSGRDYGYSVQQTFDGGYAIVGYTLSFGAGSDDVYLVKTDAGGNLQWFKTYGGSASEVAHTIKITNDVGFIICGHTLSSGAGLHDVYLIKLQTIIPVELNSFTANAIDNKVHIRWITSSELNNLGFEVQRKLSGTKSNWESIGFVEGKGTTTDINRYVFIDNDPVNGKTLYRLKQIDRDGSFSYSNEVVVEINSHPTESILYQNYPNPFNPSTMISWQSPVSGWQTLKVYDILGNEIATLVDEYRDAGRYEVEFNAAETRSGVSLPSGVYLYKLSIGNFYKIKKMLYLR